MTKNGYDKERYAPRYTPDAKYRPKPPNPNKKPEKVRGFTVASFLALLATFVVKYLLDFLIFPRLFPGLYPLSVGAIIIWLASTIVVSVISIELITGMWFFYPFADLIYAILVVIWPLGLYGTNEMIPGLMLAFAMAVLMYFLQRLILKISILISFIRL